MKQKIVKDLIKILFLFGGIFAFFYVGLQLLSEDKKNSWLYSGDEAKLISYEQEIELGNLIDEYLNEKLECIDDFIRIGKLRKQISGSNPELVP